MNTYLFYTSLVNEYFSVHIGLNNEAFYINLSMNSEYFLCKIKLEKLFLKKVPHKAHKTHLNISFTSTLYPVDIHGGCSRTDI